MNTVNPDTEKEMPHHDVRQMLFALTIPLFIGFICFDNMVRMLKEQERRQKERLSTRK